MIIHKHFRNKRKPGIFPPLFPASEAAARSKKNHQVPSLKVGAGVTQIASTSNDAHLEVSQNGDINDTYVYIYICVYTLQIIQVIRLFKYCIPWFWGSPHL